MIKKDKIIVIIGTILSLLIFAKFSFADISNTKIDINKIIKIESSYNPNAVNKRTGARGLCQIMKNTWYECTKKLKVNWSFNESFNPVKNVKIGNYYINIRIPEMLKYYNIPDTVNNRLVCYNYGIGNLNKLYKKYKNNYIKYLPKETKNYIKKYNN
jgi:soluble lytic murein transglycosylase-like protein